MRRSRRPAAPCSSSGSGARRWAIRLLGDAGSDRGCGRSLAALRLTNPIPWGSGVVYMAPRRRGPGVEVIMRLGHLGVRDLPAADALWSRRSPWHRRGRPRGEGAARACACCTAARPHRPRIRSGNASTASTARRPHQQLVAKRPTPARNSARVDVDMSRTTPAIATSAAHTGGRGAADEHGLLRVRKSDGRLALPGSSEARRTCTMNRDAHTSWLTTQVDT